jgi:predicted phosphate transport protein (TIGR00153 family)
MSEFSLSPLRMIRSIENQLDEFLDRVSETGMVLEEGVRAYVDRGLSEEVETKLQRMREVKTEGAELRRSIETALYTEMLIPDARGDVMRLLSDMQKLMDRMKDFFLEMTIRHPKMPPEFGRDFKELVAAVVKCVEQTVVAARTFFRDPRGVRDCLHKIGHYEEEADNIAIRMKTRLFDSDGELSEKFLFAEAVRVIDRVADTAKDVGERLAIFAIKRTL